MGWPCLISSPPWVVSSRSRSILVRWEGQPYPEEFAVFQTATWIQKLSVGGWCAVGAQWKGVGCYLALIRASQVPHEHRACSETLVQVPCKFIKKWFMLVMMAD